MGQGLYTEENTIGKFFCYLFCLNLKLYFFPILQLKTANSFYLLNNKKKKTPTSQSQLFLIK